MKPLKPHFGPGPSRLLLDLDKGDTCPADHAALQPLEGTLVAVVDDPDELLEFDGEFDVCPACGAVVADMISIEEILEDEGVDASAVRAFEWRGQPLPATVWGGPLEGLPWAEYAQSLDDMRFVQDAPVPEDAEVRALPQRLEAWELDARPGPPVGEAGEAELSYMALVVSPDGMIRGNAVQLEPFGAEALGNVVRRACATPMMGAGASRPTTVRVNDPLLADALASSLSGVGVRVEVGDTPLVAEAMGSLLEHMDPNPVPPFLAQHDEGEVRAFVAAAAAFFKAKPWKVFDGDKLMAFRFAGDGAWRYANVMGQAGEEFGLSVFQNWLEVCKFYNNEESPFEMLMQMVGGAGAGPGAADSPFGDLFDEGFELDPAALGKVMPKRMRAVGGMEGLTATGLEGLAGEDADYLKRLGSKPVMGDLWPGVLRYTLDGLVPPLVDLRAYTALLEACAERAAKGKRVTGMNGATATSRGELEVRFPAKGDEAPSGRSYRVSIPLLTHAEIADEVHVPLSASRPHLELLVPGDEKVSRVVREFHRTLEKKGKWSANLQVVLHGEFGVWEHRGAPLEPSPTVAQIAGLEGLKLLFGVGTSDVRIEPLEEPVAQMAARIVK